MKFLVPLLLLTVSALGQLNLSNGTANLNLATGTMGTRAVIGTGTGAVTVTGTMASLAVNGKKVPVMGGVDNDDSISFSGNVNTLHGGQSVSWGAADGSYTRFQDGIISQEDVVTSGKRRLIFPTAGAGDYNQYLQLASGTVALMNSNLGASTLTNGTLGTGTTTLLGTISGGTVSSSIVRAAAGAVAAPGLSFSGDSDTGIFSRAGGFLSFSFNGSEYITMGNNSGVGILMGSGQFLNWNSNTTTEAGSASVSLSREATGILQLGGDLATTIVPQTIKAHDVTTGTGASLTLAGGTASALGGAVILATSAATGVYIPRLTVSAGTSATVTVSTPLVITGEIGTVTPSSGFILGTGTAGTTTAALLARGTAGTIFGLNNPNAYAEIYVAGGTVAQISSGTTGVFNLITAFGTTGSAAGLSNNATVTTGTAWKLTTTIPGVYRVNASFSFAGSFNETFELQLAGSTIGQVPKIHVERKLGSGGDIGAASFSGLVTAAANEDFTIEMAASSPSDSFTLKDANFSMHWIGY